MGDSSGALEKYGGLLFVGLTFLLMAYMAIGMFLEAKKIKLLHETMVALVVAIGFGVGFRQFTGINITETISPDIIFQFILPPIVFGAGFNIRKEFFFKNAIYIAMFGFIATIINFVVCTVIFYYGNLKVQEWLNIEGSTYTWSLMAIMKMTSTLIASDTIAPLTTIDEYTYPTLFSIIFGEGMTNDAVALILMNTLIQLEKSGATTVSTETMGQFSIQFARSSIVSILFGFGMGGVSCIIHKVFRDISHFAILETGLVFLMAITTYSICELPQVELAGIVAVFIFGITQSHYNRYNLSIESIEKAGFTFGVLGYICEAFILIYLGLSFDHFQFETEMFVYAGLDFFLLLIARIIVTFFIIFAMQIISRGKSLTYRQGVLITLGGMIRGAIAYALIVKLSNEKDR